MSIQIVPIDNVSHANLRVNGSVDFRHAADHHLTRVTANEIALASMDYPVVLIREPGTERLHCAAMFGFENGENLYFREGKWRSTYIPANVTIVPFAFGSAAPDNSTLVPGIDENSRYVNTETGQALFDEAGRKTAFLKTAEKNLEAIYTNEMATQRFVDRLKALELLQSFSLEVAYADGRRKSVVGMYMVSNEKLEALPESEVIDFFRNGYLVPIYAMLSSLNQVQRMIEYRNERDGPAITDFEYKLVTGN